MAYFLSDFFRISQSRASTIIASLVCILCSPCRAQNKQSTKPAEAAPQPARRDLIQLLQSNPALWQSTPDSFAEGARSYGFAWESPARESARANRVPLSLASMPVAEALARFSDQKLTALSMLFYSRGDSGEMSRGDYEKLVAQSVEALNKLTKMKPQPRAQDGGNAVRAEGFIWKTPGTVWTLEYSAGRTMTPRGVQVSPEFVRLELAPEKSNQRNTASASKTAPIQPKQKVRKLPTGDTFIEGIPMVDQGPKGYCFPASAERVLRYYGMRVDQHEIAQLAGNRGQGASLSGGVEGLKLAGSRLQFRVRMVDNLEIKDLENLVREYNVKVLKYGQKAQIPPLSGAIDLEGLYFSMRPDALLAARQALKLEKNRFLRAIQGSVDAGHPMIWGVLMGLAPEQKQGQQPSGSTQPSPQEANPPQTTMTQRGGHARLIIGYNAKTQECLYSDSWGAGHELKRMSYETAWLMHQFCFLLIPQGIETPSLSQDK
jgi:hypothetical protein